MNKKHLLAELVGIILVLVVILSGIRLAGYRLIIDPSHGGIFIQGKENLGIEKVPDWIDVQIVPINGVGRRGVELDDGVNDIVLHYVGNPGTTAQQNHDYYATETTTVSSHFIVGLEGEIILCVPLNEKSSATNWRNADTISIETCHPDETGVYTDATYTSMVKLTAWLCDQFNLDISHIIRHGDVTGKNCPKLFMEDEIAWKQFKEDVNAYLSNNTEW